MPSRSATIDPKAGKRFQLVRKHLKLNQAAMAELCEISKSMVCMIESGQRDIPSGVLKILFEKRKVSPTYIVAGAPPMIFQKDERNSLVTNIRELQTDIEIMKSHIKHLYKE